MKIRVQLEDINWKIYTHYNMIWYNDILQLHSTSLVEKWRMVRGMSLFSSCYPNSRLLKRRNSTVCLSVYFFVHFPCWFAPRNRSKRQKFWSFSKKKLTDGILQKNWLTEFYKKNWLTEFYKKNWLTDFYKKNWLTEFYKKNFFLSFFFPDACNIQKLTFFQNFCKIPPVKIFFYIFLATSKIDILPKLLSNSAGWIFFYIFLFTISCTHFNFVKRRFLTKIVDLLHPNAPIFVRLSVCVFFCPFSMLICP